IIGSNQVKLRNDNSGNLVFDFPTPDTKGNEKAGLPSINYLYTTYTGSLEGYKAISITLQVTTTGTPFFNYTTEAFNTCACPSHARPFFWSNGTELGDEFGR